MSGFFIVKLMMAVFLMIVMLMSVVVMIVIAMIVLHAHDGHENHVSRVRASCA